MKKLFFVFLMLLVSKAFSAETPVVTPMTGPCPDCVLERTAEFDLLVLRGGLDLDLRICRIELNHDCPDCPVDDSIKVLGAGGVLGTIQNGGFMNFGPNDPQPTKAILFLNSIKLGQTFSVTLCAGLRRVVVGSQWTALPGANFSGAFNFSTGAVGANALPFKDGVHIDGLRYKVERRCLRGIRDNVEVYGDWVRFFDGFKPVLQGNNENLLANVVIPALVQTGAGTFGEAGNNEPWKCLEGKCQFKVTFGEFDRCFRLLDDLCRDIGCRPTAMKLHFDARIRANFVCLEDNCHLDG